MTLSPASPERSCIHGHEEALEVVGNRNLQEIADHLQVKDEILTLKPIAAFEAGLPDSLHLLLFQGTCCLSDPDWLSAVSCALFQ